MDTHGLHAVLQEQQARQQGVGGLAALQLPTAVVTAATTAYGQAAAGLDC